MQPSADFGQLIAGIGLCRQEDEQKTILPALFKVTASDQDERQFAAKDGESSDGEEIIFFASDRWHHNNLCTLNDVTLFPDLQPRVAADRGKSVYSVMITQRNCSILGDGDALSLMAR